MARHPEARDVLSMSGVERSPFRPGNGALHSRRRAA